MTTAINLWSFAITFNGCTWALGKILIMSHLFALHQLANSSHLSILLWQSETNHVCKEFHPIQDSARYFSTNERICWVVCKLVLRLSDGSWQELNYKPVLILSLNESQFQPASFSFRFSFTIFSLAADLTTPCL